MTETEHDLDVEEVLSHYIAAALWSSNDESTPSGGEPLDKRYTRDDIHPDTLERMRQDVTAFVNANHADLSTWDGSTTVEEQAGHDFWLNRNGHGCGFWESEWGEPGERLDIAAHAFGTFDLYIGDDGKIHGS